jgi:hypothetical protein
MKSFGRKSSRFGKSAWPGGDELVWRIAGDVITGHWPGFFMDRGKTVTQCKPRAKPFRARSIGLHLVARSAGRAFGGEGHGGIAPA